MTTRKHDLLLLPNVMPRGASSEQYNSDNSSVACPLQQAGDHTVRTTDGVDQGHVMRRQMRVADWLRDRLINAIEAETVAPRVPIVGERRRSVAFSPISRSRICARTVLCPLMRGFIAVMVFYSSLVGG